LDVLNKIDTSKIVDASRKLGNFFSLDVYEVIANFSPLDVFY